MQEEAKSISEILEEVKTDICDTRCKYPDAWDEKNGPLCESEECQNCPLNRL